MGPTKILLFSADLLLANNLITCLTEAGYKVNQFLDGIGGIERIQSERPSLIILDIGLAGLSSLAIIRQLRSGEAHHRTPIILIGSDMHEEDVLIGLEVGADLCLIEEFHPQVFIARVRSLIRRNEHMKVQT